MTYHTVITTAMLLLSQNMQANKTYNAKIWQWQQQQHLQKVSVWQKIPAVDTFLQYVVSTLTNAKMQTVLWGLPTMWIHPRRFHWVRRLIFVRCRQSRMFWRICCIAFIAACCRCTFPILLPVNTQYIPTCSYNELTQQRHLRCVKMGLTYF